MVAEASCLRRAAAPSRRGGEASESGGNAEYIADAMAAGQPKGMIVLGHMLSEDFGMREVGDWLRGFLTDVPIDWIPAGEPFE